MGIIFPMVRMIAQEEFGFVPESVTRKEFEVLQYEYAATEMAGYWNDDRLVFEHIRLPDLDHDNHGLLAILPQEAALEFSLACKEFRKERALDAEYDDQSSCGYSWAPIGMNEGYGYYSPVDAWLITKPQGSVLLYRETDEERLEDALNIWLEYWLQMPMPSGWPAPSERLSTLIVPEEMQKVQLTRRMLNMHKRKTAPSRIRRRSHIS